MTWTSALVAAAHLAEANRVASLNILKGGCGPNSRRRCSSTPEVSRAGTTPPPSRLSPSGTPYHAVSVEEREDRDLVLVITKLAQDKIDGRRNRIGAAGVTVWKTVFKGKSKQEVIADVEWYLSGSDRSRVFYYRDVIDDEETGKTKLMGLFQSFVFSHVFTVHCNATATDGHLGPLGYPTTVPEGALTLTCHVVSYFLFIICFFYPEQVSNKAREKYVECPWVDPQANFAPRPSSQPGAAQRRNRASTLPRNSAVERCPKSPTSQAPAPSEKAEVSMLVSPSGGT
ncbi:hypothetical protein B0H10DRAFT_2196537 [Mycena sp. CBHHK59/15]|nr:hypothetical protein B0H10DRAFT_2202024 [Mycena sp. CBHHK59/15]KAJ6599485.1 hypothetical protein B0H10DRAFT_2196537 [Mycena sp. CBHHK59/15]